MQLIKSLAPAGLTALAAGILLQCGNPVEQSGCRADLAQGRTSSIAALEAVGAPQFFLQALAAADCVSLLSLSQKPYPSNHEGAPGERYIRDRFAAYRVLDERTVRGIALLQVMDALRLSLSPPFEETYSCFQPALGIEFGPESGSLLLLVCDDCARVVFLDSQLIEHPYELSSAHRYGLRRLYEDLGLRCERLE